MRFSICVMADVDEIGFFSHAETLGYDSVWVTDSQMLFSDCYAVLALAAQQTRRIRSGPRGGHLRHAHPAGARGRDGDPEPARPGPRAPGRRHRQHRHPLDGPAADAHRGVRGVPARAARPAPGRAGGLHAGRRDAPDQDADPREEVHEPRAAASRSTSPPSARGPWSWPASTATASSSRSRRAGSRPRRPSPGVGSGPRGRAASSATTSTRARSPTSCCSSRASRPTPSASSARWGRT